MKTLLLLALTSIITSSAFLALTVSAPKAIPVKKTMRAFRSEQELLAYIHKATQKSQQRLAEEEMMKTALAPASIAGEAPPPAQAQAESVTNTQHAGVDEGGIVKVHGDHLVVLRRGRLFTVAIGEGALKPISSIDAFGPDIDPADTWYDEMLVSADTVVVIGYSYQRGGTEVGLFDINSDGRLAYRSTYHLRSNDYYSSRNYASRLIGNKLIFYAPQNFNGGSEDAIQSFPAVRKWHKGATASEFQRIVPAARVYRPETELNPDYGTALHTVTVCDLANGRFDCQATSVIGPPGHVFYVSPDSVYVWASTWGRNEQNRSIIFRLPLDGSGPSALRVSGSPVDQFSFLQSEDQYLNVFVESRGKGDGMWRAEVTSGDVALLRIPLWSFSDGSDAAPSWSYRPLSRPGGYGYRSRFVGNYLIYGTGNSWGYPKDNLDKRNLFLVNWERGNSYQLKLEHDVDRIEQMGTDAVIVGTDGKDLHFSAIRLDQWPEIVSRYTRKEASQGETRSHGFFYKPDGDESGMLGLPISVPARPGFKHLFENSAAILFLRNDALQFREVGELGSQPERAIDDQCRASCVDWYGNARPLFLRGRVFALLGYEIVEGRVENGRMSELRRVNYAPHS